MSTSNSEDEALPYAVVVRRRGNRFSLTVSELGLICDTDDLAAGYRELQNAIRDLVAVHGEGSRPAELPGGRPGAETAGSSIAMRAGDGEPGVAGADPSAIFRKYLYITGIVVLLTTVPVWLSLSLILRDAVSVLRDYRTVADTVAALDTPAKTAHFFNKRLRLAAETLAKVTPRRKEQMRRDLRLIVRVLKPLADEVRPLFTGEKLPTLPRLDLPGEGGVSDTGAR